MADLRAYSASQKTATADKVRAAMRKIEVEQCGDKNLNKGITFRSVRRCAGITEQTLHGKGHRALKQEVLDWKVLCPRKGLVASQVIMSPELKGRTTVAPLKMYWRNISLL